MKYLIVLFLFLSSFLAGAQKIDSIYVNLYTDSLKKGTFNYINVDGKLSNGRYVPLDTTDISLACDEARFTGNDLWIPKDFTKEKVTIHVTLLSDPAVRKTFSVHIKQQPDPELKSEQEVLDEMKKNHQKKKNH